MVVLFVVQNWNRIVWKYFNLIQFSVGKRGTIGMIKVMLCLGVYDKKDNTTFKL